MDTPTRAFKGVWIPAKLWDAKDISWMQKCLAAEIDALDNGDGCFASNDYLAQFFGSSTASIANQISDLRAKGYIEDLGFDGRRRRIRVNPEVKAGLTVELRQASPAGEGSHNRQVTIGTKPVTKPVTRVEDTPTPYGDSCDYVIDVDGYAVNADVIMKEWNKLPPPFPKIREMTEKRLRLVKQRMKNLSWVNGWREALAIAPNVPFLRGEGGKGWVMDFEYFMRPDSVIKIIEGKRGVGQRRSNPIATVPLRENEVPKVANVAEELRKRGISTRN